MRTLSRTKIAFLILMVALFAVPIPFERIFRLYSMPLTGWPRPTWAGLFFAASLSLVALPVVTGIRIRRISPLDIACWAAVFVAWVAYPFGIRTYCDLASRNRSDTWHWTGRDGTYYFVDSRYPDAFSGLIDTYPPYFSLPKR